MRNVHVVDFCHFDVFVRHTYPLAACFLDNACFEGLPLIPKVLFPPEQEFEILCDAVKSEGVLFDPQNQSLLRCLEQGWLHMEEDMERKYWDDEDMEEEDTEPRFKCYFPTIIHQQYELCSLLSHRLPANLISESWSISLESRTPSSLLLSSWTLLLSFRRLSKRGLTLQ